MTFADHFSRQSGQYLAYRPRYPPALFAFLASCCDRRELAWDCACGSGQATLGLARHFQSVVATDASRAQIELAPPHSRVQYRVAEAHQPGLAGQSVDLLAVAQALHWFAVPGFFAQARLVLRPAGIIAAWAYGLHRIDGAVDVVIDRLYHDIVGPFWPPQRRLIDEAYATIAFPFPRREAPDFQMVHRWTLPQLRGYLGTWSAVQAYREDQGADPLDLIEMDLAAAWGPAETPRAVRWPIHLLLGAAH